MSITEEKEKEIKNKLMGIEDFHELAVRVDDTDLMQVVHANKYLNYFDDGFISFTSKLNKDCGALHKQGIVFPVRKIEIEYINSATFGDKILIHTRVIHVGNTSITLAMDCYKNTKSKDTLLVKGSIVRLILDMNKNKLLKITEFFSDIL
ncbi:MAG: acyl-CoA thioesterase [Promethearchaeota archaeon]